MVELKSLLAIAAIIQTAIGGIMAYVALALSSMKSDTRERLAAVQRSIDNVNGRVRALETGEAKIEEWRKDHSRMAERCQVRFDRLEGRSIRKGGN